MKNNSLRQISFAAFAIYCFGGSLALAQNNNPTGAAGFFNGNSATGCSFDPLTANATRKILDITIDAAVGAYPLQWARTMNSRAPGGSGFLFGAGGGWSHSYAWSIDDSEIFNTTTAGTPTYYVVRFPDGRVIRFNPAGSADTCYRGALGIRERFQQIDQTTLLAYLILPDGGKVEFLGNRWHYRDPDYGTWTSGYTYQAQAIIDPSGLRTVFTYNADGTLSKVTESAGRWLQITYASGRISQVQSGYGSGVSSYVTQIVNYVYTTFGAYTVLAGANYNDGTSASYTYQASNVTGGSGYPLIKTCSDVRYPGPMKLIAYDFVAGGFYGQLWKEKHIGGTVVATLTISGNTRTETRGDGPVRTFTYGPYVNPSPALPADFIIPAAAPYLLSSITDFKGNKTYFGYDAKGYLNKLRDANLRVTSFSRAAKTGNLLSVTHPGDGSAITYTYTDQTTGYYLSSVKDELLHTTSYTRDASMNITRIDYPDLAFETFGAFNAMNQSTTHTNTSGGTETFAYDARGMLTSYTPPVTPSDPNPSAHPTRYDYDANDHLSHITDPRSNVTTLYHNWIGQLTIVQHPGGSMRGWVYNNDGTLNLFGDENGANTTYTYDDFKRVKTIVRPLRYTGDASARTTTLWYDTTGTTDDYSHTDAQATFVTTPAGVDTANVYDENFRVLSTTLGDTSRTDSSPAITSYIYDAVGNVERKKDPNGQTTGAEWVYTYDARDRLATVDDPTVNYPTGANKNSLAHTINYTYDSANNRTSVQYANDQVVSYDTYDAMNRLTQMTVIRTLTPLSTAVTKYSWTKSGKLDTMTDLDRRFTITIMMF
jgi:YD repeat-containing protein